MADEADRAQEREEQQRADALAAQARRSQTDGVEHEFCTKCEDPIPPARRVALPGVELCVECAERGERTNKLRGR
ncbi:MAG: TraR/DksA C4-type zinc finger protein [Nitrosomonadales bacterium]|nr:TraR/DksA C4-type zinc finger protein [Nitrosomonadales bacterium]